MLNDSTLKYISSPVDSAKLAQTPSPKRPYPWSVDPLTQKRVSLERLQNPVANRISKNPQTPSHKSGDIFLTAGHTPSHKSGGSFTNSREIVSRN
jgi:hypothetical protein